MRRLILHGAAITGLALGSIWTGMAHAEVTFRDPLNNEPITIPEPTGAAATEAVATFRATGENPYAGQAEAVGAGQKLYDRWCQACHLKDGTGRIGPSLVDDKHVRARTDTDIGQFEIIHEGGAGAMQPFGSRLTQDEILKLIAYIHELRARHGS
jgi:cytochrome c-L